MDSSFPFLAAVDFSTLPEQLLNGILSGAIYALIALGYTMVYGILRLINFAHGEVYMLGAYIALFASYAVGFGPDSTKTDSNILNLLIMLLGSMFLCALVGVVIERFAYRPMRAHSRIASLITAIGVSLLLQFGGALFLPVSPPPSIAEAVNPPYLRESKQVALVSGDPALEQKVEELEPAFKRAEEAFERYLAESGDNQYGITSPEGIKLRDEFQQTQTAYNNARRQASTSGVKVTVRMGQAVILGVTVVLMGILTYLVLFTKPGRAMRAVSHDYDSASLMGVNVGKIVTFTFILGSALAGAGAMMQATFLGTPLTTFMGLILGVKAFVAAVLGGIGNIPGAVVGGLLIGVAEAVATWVGYSDYRDAIAFVVLIVVLLFRPGGILGSSKVEKV